MAIAVFFLLSGMLAAELAVLGVAPAGLVGAGLFAASALVLATRARAEQPAAQHVRNPKDEVRARRSPVAVKP